MFNFTVHMHLLLPMVVVFFGCIGIGGVFRLGLGCRL